MKALDKALLRELIGAIGDAQHKLRELGQLSEQAFLADFRNTESAKYLLIVASEAAIDICNHIAARQEGRAPEDYADCFEVLVELQILDPKFAERLQQMARFRNLLVHVYQKVDNRRVYQFIHTSLNDLDAYREVIAGLIL
ncbi:MAG TPA: DUF86 domain-containing protein [Caldilineaceae bacterium]|nr:DUF86 domain-containing protein [Caldilineaceae bacterium]